MSASSRVRVHNLAMSIDGYAAGVDQRLEEPLGVGFEAFHEWMFATPCWLAMTGQEVPAGADRGPSTTG